jgi:hypothetical protein
MSFALGLWAGRFDFASEPGVRPLDLERVAAILAEYSDRDPDGSVPARRVSRDGRRTTLGWCGGVPVLFDSQGFITAQVGVWDTSRLFPFLARLVTEFGCAVYARDGGEDWTEAVLAATRPTAAE